MSRAVALVLALTACAKPEPTAPANANANVALAPTVAFRDPTHHAETFATMKTSLESASPALTARFDGKLEVDHDALGPWAPAQAHVVAFALRASVGGGAEADVRSVRVTGFDGIRVGLGPLAEPLETPTVEGFVGALLWSSVELLAKQKGIAAPEPTPSLAVPRGRMRVGTLNVAIPEDASPGRHSGKLEVTGNFDSLVVPIDIDVVRYEDQFDAALAHRGARESDLALSQWLARNKQIEVSTNGDIDPNSAWGRWVVAGNGVWDLGSMTWLGPIVDAHARVDALKAIAGPPNDPRLFVVNDASSVDVISLRERRTLARLESPHRNRFDLLRALPFRVTPDGARVAIACGDDLCVYTQNGERWERRIVPTPAPFPMHTEWSEVDADIRERARAIRFHTSCPRPASHTKWVPATSPTSRRCLSSVAAWVRRRWRRVLKRRASIA